MDALADLRVVLTHDWLTGMRGGEKVLEFFCRRWPDAHLFTLLHKRGSVCADIERLKIRTSFLQWLPAVHRYYRYMLPLMPWAVNWRLPPCDLVVSSSHCVAKGVTVPAGVPHVCYCYTPMRYAWNLRSQYFSGVTMESARVVARPYSRSSARLGPAHRRRRDAFHRHQPGRAGTHPAVLWPIQRGDLSSGQHRLLLPGSAAAGRLLPVVLRVRPLQKARPGH